MSLGITLQLGVDDTVHDPDALSSPSLRLGSLPRSRHRP